MIAPSFRKYDQIIYVNDYTLANQVLEGDIHGALEGGASVDEPKRHSFVCEHPPLSGERHFVMILIMYHYLVVPGVSFKERHHLGAVDDLQHLIQ